MSSPAPITAGGDATAAPQSTRSNELPKLDEIPAETNSGMFFVFTDDGSKEVAIPESWKRLSGFIQDFPMVDNKLPLGEYYAEDMELIKQVLDEFRTTSPAAYLAALNGQNDAEINDIPPILNDVSDQTRIRAANLTDYLSLTLGKRIILSWFAEQIMNTQSDDIAKITSMLGSEPLTIEDVRSFGLENERSLWEAYPSEYRRIFGRNLDDAPGATDAASA